MKLIPHFKDHILTSLSMHVVYVEEYAFTKPVCITNAVQRSNVLSYTWRCLQTVVAWKSSDWSINIHYKMTTIKCFRGKDASVKSKHIDGGHLVMVKALLLYRHVS